MEVSKHVMGAEVTSWLAASLDASQERSANWRGTGEALAEAAVRRRDERAGG